MDPRINPYAPGAGTLPPALAGRDDVIMRAEIALDRIRAGRPARSFIFYGLRGVGKTVLLNRIRLDADARGFTTVRLEAPESRSLPGLLAPSLRLLLLRLDRSEGARAGVERAWRALSGFVRGLKIKYGDIEVALDAEGERGLADSGDLELDLTDLLSAIGHAARERRGAVVLFLDELQYVAETELGALISALHQAAQEQLPITMIAAGLPQLLGRMGRAKSYAERLFEFVPIDRLPDEAARQALTLPAMRENVEFEPAAVDQILAETAGYPYFLQAWGKHCWDLAEPSRITAKDAAMATEQALAELDASFFRVRFDRLTPKEKTYIRVMATLGPGPHRSGDIAEALGRPVSSVAPLRNSLIEKGMIYSPAHGDTAFTVPLFDAFMRRVVGPALPEEEEDDKSA